MASSGSSHPLSRRALLVTAVSAARVLGANDRIRVGIIGTGGMGGSHLRALTEQSEKQGDIQVGAASDVYQKRKERAQALAKLSDKDIHHDYRELLARQDIDAVFIVTPDHWHAQMALDALAAGKDAYLQKPMTLTFEEAKAVAESAARLERILQVGGQHVSDPRHHVARKLIEQGEIGTLLWAQGSACRNSLRGEWNDRIDEDASPANLDWDRWLGSAPKRPFSAERYFRWRKYWDYSGGIATDLFYHVLGPLMFDTNAGFPTRVSGAGGIYVQKDRQVPDSCAMLVEFPNFFVVLSGSMANATGGQHLPWVVHGNKGTISFKKDMVVLQREQTYSPGAPAQEIPVEGGEIHRLHTDNFFASMRSRKAPNLDAQLGYRVMTAIKLGVDSYRTGRQMHFDPDNQRLVAASKDRPEYEGDGRNYPPEPRRG